RGDEGPHHLHRRPPPLHYLAGRRDRGHGPGPRRRPRHARGAARALPAVRGDRREGARGLGLPAARPRGARGDGEAVNETSGAHNFLALFRSIWRLIRGEDNRGRKVKWLFSLLRPYRRQVLMTLGALLLATAATLAPPALIGAAVAAALHGHSTTLALLVA